MRGSKGFTLIELLVVVSLMIIVVGVTGDIVISLIRSYNKTQITNEVEQNANFVITKIEKELRNASSATVVSDQVLQINRRLPTGAFESIVYELKNNGEGVPTIYRNVDDSGDVVLINNSDPDGVEMIVVGGSGCVKGLNSCFIEESTDPTVIKIMLTFKQIGNPMVQFTQNIDLESTVIVRGSY